MDKALEDVKTSGYTEIMLWVFTANANARAFYEAKGFHSTYDTKIGLGAEDICYLKRL